ncbi:hypothetical protein EXS65_03380 [Candidatus Peribacteria bacterium]|nr:hypothetical protein [Candidatus Peribacteria bacterium]
MSLSSFCLVLGVFFYVFGFPLVFCDERYALWRRKIMKDSNLVRIIGMAFAMIAVTTLRRNFALSFDIRGFVVVFAWLLFFKSIAMAWWPEAYEKWHRAFEKKFLHREASQIIAGISLVLLGAWFSYLGILLPL